MDSLHGIERVMFHGHLNYFQKPPLGGGPNTKPRDHGTPNAHNHWFILILSYVRTRVNRNSLKSHLVEGPVTYDFTLHLRVCDHTTTWWCWRCVGTMAFGHFSCGLSQSHGHGSWLVCEVALRGGLHYGPWSRPTIVYVMWLDVEVVPGRLGFTPRKKW
jgi:hypothetical protein